MGGVDMTSFGIPVVGRTYGVWNPGAFLFVFLFALQYLTILLGGE